MNKIFIILITLVTAYQALPTFHSYNEENLITNEISNDSLEIELEEVTDNDSEKINSQYTLLAESQEDLTISGFMLSNLPPQFFIDLKYPPPERS